MMSGIQKAISGAIDFAQLLREDTTGKHNLTAASHISGIAVISEILARKNEQLRLEKDKKSVRIARLEGVIDKVDMYHGHCHDIKCNNESNNECECGHIDAHVVLSETPQQSLAEIEAAAVEKYKDALLMWLDQEHGASEDFIKGVQAAAYSAERHANKLRQQGGE